MFHWDTPQKDTQLPQLPRPNLHLCGHINTQMWFLKIKERIEGRRKEKEGGRGRGRNSLFLRSLETKSFNSNTGSWWVLWILTNTLIYNAKFQLHMWPNCPWTKWTRRKALLFDFGSSVSQHQGFHLLHYGRKRARGETNMGPLLALGPLKRRHSSISPPPPHFQKPAADSSISCRTKIAILRLLKKESQPPQQPSLAAPLRREIEGN